MSGFEGIGLGVRDWGMGVRGLRANKMVLASTSGM
jgi:hypothetical protein